MRGYLYALLCVGMVAVSPILSKAQPTANFTASTTSGCSPIVVNFTDLSTGSPTSWSWDLGNGTTSTLQNPSTTYVTAGTYTVKLTASNSSGSNTKIVTGYITVLASPIVSFTASDTIASCPPQTITFTNTSVPGASGTTSYTWDFGDGTGSTSVNPSHTYTTAGAYNVSLVVTNSNGCSKSLVKSSYIQMTAKPTAGFSASNTTSCTAPATISFTNSTTGATSYSWDFGDGGTSSTASPSHTYSSAGTYTVRLIATNSAGCPDTVIKTSYITVNSLHAAFSTSSSKCSGQNIAFTNSSTGSPTSYTWLFGDGTTATSANPTHAYGSAGTYTVKLIATKGTCNDTATTTITVNPTPTANFSGDTVSSCRIPVTTNFTNLSSGGTSYYWTFDDGGSSTATNPSHTYTSYGYYTVKLHVTNSYGCQDSMIKGNYVAVQPLNSSIAPVQANNCLSTPVSFTNTTTGTLSSYSWNFGDGTTSTTAGLTPTHTYTTAGTYTVTFSYTTTSGCSGTATTHVTVSTKPTASFTSTATPICPDNAVTFTNGSTGATHYTWLFGDGTSSTSTNPTHVYSWSDTFSVTLIADNNGCPDTLKKSNLVVVYPTTADFTVAYSCSNKLQVSFTNTTGPGTTWSWNFGDGTTSTVRNPVHTYSSYGTDTVALTVTDTTTHCTNTKKVVLTLATTVATFRAKDTICKGSILSLYVNTTANVVNTWTFGDGNSRATGLDTIQYKYPTSDTAGLYTIKLVSTDAHGCTDSSTQVEHVGGPFSNFTTSSLSPCPPLTVYFYDTAKRGTDYIAKRKWTFGDGSVDTANNATPNHTFTGSNPDTVTEIVTDVYGCTSAASNVIIPLSKPYVAFSSLDTSVCPGHIVRFANASTGAGITFTWYFGDGTTTNSVNPTHTYTTGGNYTVKLVAVTSSGCSDSVTRTAYIHVNRLNLGFNMSDSFTSCPPLNVNFTNTSTGISNYAWSFGNGGRSILTNPSTLYTYPGVYTVKLVGTATNGCTDSTTKTVTVNGPKGTFSYTPTIGCGSTTISFTSTDTNAATITWDMNNGYTSTSTISGSPATKTFSYTYTTSGTYVPVITLTDGASCRVSVFGTDTIKIDKLVADFSFTPDSFCSAGTVSFTDTVISAVSPVASRSWSFGDGGTSTAHNPTHIYTAPGNYTVRLVMATSIGCHDTITKTVVIFAPPTISAGADKSLCNGIGSVTLNATGGSSYSWSPATGLSCTNCANPIASPTSTTTYIVTGTDTHGCTNTDTVVVRIRPLPTVSAGTDKTICAGSSTTLSAAGGSSYSWSPSTGLSCTSCASPTATPASTTTYIVTGTDSNGCSNTDTITVNVHIAPSVNAGVDKAICAGSSTLLSATGAVSYSWSPTTGLSCTSCASPTANPSVTTNYVVTGTDSFGCTNKDTVIVHVNPLPTVSAGPDQAACSVNSVSLTATGASSYSWSPATGLSCTTCANPSATPTSTTRYVVTGTDANGCVNTDTVVVTIGTLPTVSAGPDRAVCKGSTTTLTATGASTYSWSPATGLSCTSCANPTDTVNATTTYVVTGTSAAGCIGHDTITITAKPLPTVSAGADKIICKGSSVSLNATGASSYNWSPATGLSCTGCASPVVSVTSTTSYVVTGTDSSGCVNKDTIVVKVNPFPTVSVGPDKAICAGASVSLNATGASSYNWSPATGLSCTTCVSPTASPTSTTTYTVTGTDTNGCVNSDTITITVNPLPAVKAGADQSICKNSTTTLTATGASTYTWSPTTGLSCATCASTSATVSSTTTYIVTGTSAAGCTAKDTVVVTIKPLPTVDAGPDAGVCKGGSVELKASGAVSYVWTPTATLSCSTCDSTLAMPGSTTTYSVVGTAANGCKDTDNVVVTVYQPPVITVTHDTILCNGSSIQLNASGASTYSWRPASSLSCNTCPSPVANPSTTTTYVVTGVDVHGCADSNKVTVNVIDRAAITIGPDDTLCKGQSANLYATGGSDYEWVPSDGLNNSTVSDPVANPDTTTTYTVIIKQKSCFTDTEHVTVVVYPIPTVSLGADQTIFAGSSVQLYANGSNILTYEWTPSDGLSCTDCQNPTAIPKKTITYTVNVTGAGGCKAQDDITINVRCESSQVFVPNTFTPNGDGLNDRFYPSGKGISSIKRFSVYNRWGELVYQMDNMPLNDPTIGWDGTYKGMQAKPDVFVYIISATCETGDPIEIKGDVSLVR
ncbi:MAG: PKD domain-containing protein [Flavipsychrobacter sp.]